MRRLQLYENGSAPPSPETDRVYLYAKADGNLYFKTSDGVEHSLGGGQVLTRAGNGATSVGYTFAHHPNVLGQTALLQY